MTEAPISQFSDIRQLLPQAGRAVFLRDIIKTDNASIICSMIVPAQPIPQAVDNTSASSCGIEYIAQACAALSGLALQQKHMPVRAGYLVSVRKCSITVPYFQVGEQLFVSADLQQTTEDVSIFEGALYRKPGEPFIMSATLSIYHPSHE